VLVEADAGPRTAVGRVWLTDFRCFDTVDVVLAPGLTVVHGANGQGKTSLLEAIGWVARGRSFRGVPDAALVRAGAAQAVVRAEITDGERDQLFEAEIRAVGRNRILRNRQPVTRRRDLHGLLRVTVFSPDDLAVVKEGPTGRRDYLDDLLSALAVRYDAARGDYDRVLRQRNALLRAGVRGDSDRATLAVFDDQLVAAAAEVVRGRLRLLDRLQPVVRTAYAALAGPAGPVHLAYDAHWADGPLDSDDADVLAARLREAIERRRRAEVERGVTLVGPHRDDVVLAIGGLDARTQASQGEQRTLALALRLAGHDLVSDLVGAAPVLLLDDVFSELDAARADALVHNLPPGQTLVTTTGALPSAIAPEHRLRLHGGRVDDEDAR
jgi:DNA replication and repair protein RecF